MVTPSSEREKEWLKKKKRDKIERRETLIYVWFWQMTCHSKGIKRSRSD